MLQAVAEHRQFSLDVNGSVQAGLVSFSLVLHLMPRPLHTFMMKNMEATQQFLVQLSTSSTRIQGACQPAHVQRQHTTQNELDSG